MTDETATRGIFVIDGEEIPFPDFTVGFTMDEAMAFYEYTSFAIEDLIVDEDADEDELEEIQKKMRGPHVLSGLMHIAYCRSHPKATKSRVSKLVKGTSFSEAFSRLGESEDGDEDPPSEESTSTLNESSMNKLVGSENTNEQSKESSGTSSKNGLSEPENLPVTTGHGNSDTSSPPSDPMTLAL